MPALTPATSPSSARALPRLLLATGLALAAAACGTPTPAAGTPGRAPGNDYAVLNRLTWGANDSAYAALRRDGRAAYVRAQLHPAALALPPDAQAQIDRMTISRTPLPDLARQLEQQRRQADAAPDEAARKEARQALQQTLQGLAQEAATRHLLRALYSPQQVREQMVWFWLNHFNVFQGKAYLRALVGDYEEQAIRPRALGKFRDLLGAVVTHPAMLLYLDNGQNALDHLNENLARELMELHTLGVDGGYTQGDVQELARVLTGVGLSLREDAPRLRPALRGYYVRRGLFEFNPARHDFGAKAFLGQPVRGRGLDELNEVLDRLAAHPATAAFVSRKLAQFWLSDAPPPALVARMAQAFTRSGGDIAATLQVLFDAPEFARPDTRKFKDPMHYVLSAVRLAYDGKPILNARPLLHWLNRLGEPLYGRATPDGYPLTSEAWNGSGQMATRFEIAKVIGAGSAGLFQPDAPGAAPRHAFPQLANALYYEAIADTLGPATRQALDQAASPQEWNAFLLAAPEFMYR